jgi:hypothetical protein
MTNGLKYPSIPKAWLVSEREEPSLEIGMSDPALTANPETQALSSQFN